MSRKNAVIATTVGDGGVLNFTVDGAGSFSVNPAELSDDVRAAALQYGLIRKVSGGAAISADDLTGDKEKDNLTKFEAMQAVASQLKEGVWSKRSGDGSGSVSGIIYTAFAEWVAAMAAKKGVEAPSAEQTRAVYDSKDRAGQLALRNVPAIAKIIDRIKSERGADKTAPVDTGELLGELGI